VVAPTKVRCEALNKRAKNPVLLYLQWRKPAVERRGERYGAVMVQLDV
jgi:hypothetical protein